MLFGNVNAKQQIYQEGHRMEKTNEILKGYDSQIDRMGGKFGTAEQAARIKKVILEKLPEEKLMYLTTISPTGWPETSVVHFVSDNDTDNNPIFYVFTQPQFKKVENIPNNPRSAISIFHMPKKGAGKPWVFQFSALAELLEYDPDKEAAAALMKKKQGIAGEFMTKKLQAQPCIRINPVLGTWSMPEGFGKPNSTPIDFTK